VYVKQFF